MNNNYAPSVLAFALVVVGISYAPVPLWFKVVTVISGVAMLIISAAVVVGMQQQNEKTDA